MQTIQAMVNPRLLTKASRLFTGSLQGRIIEILQNARRAGATSVSIENRDGKVIVNDNGNGIEDFSTLLDLGSSGWHDGLEHSEDPAGVGVFCLAPRQVTISSKGRTLTVTDAGWTGARVAVKPAKIDRRGTRLEFEDEPWTFEAVEPNAVFTGMDVIVDGKPCQQAAFASDRAVPHLELGCRIEVVEGRHLNEWHDHWRRQAGHGNVFVNFHGQIVSMTWRPVHDHTLHYLIDMTGEPTDIRLMLPARTQLVENPGLKALKEAIEREAYRFYQRRGWHRQGYQEYLRARQLGIDLPEAEPTYDLGLLFEDDVPGPVALSVSKDFPLNRCYRIRPQDRDNETLKSNTHLLAALGKLDQPFVPVHIRGEYDGYSWADLPVIEKAEIAQGKSLQRNIVWQGELRCVDALTITVHTSDGQVYQSPVCMAIQPLKHEKQLMWWDAEVLVTPHARNQLEPENVMYHLGGFCDDGDTWDTQQAQFEESWECFWDQLVGPDERGRRRVMEMMEHFTSWHTATLTASGAITLHFEDGSNRTIHPPTDAKLPTQSKEVSQ